MAVYKNTRNLCDISPLLLIPMNPAPSLQQAPHRGVSPRKFLQSKKGLNEGWEFLVQQNNVCGAAARTGLFHTCQTAMLKLNLILMCVVSQYST